MQHRGAGDEDGVVPATPCGGGCGAHGPKPAATRDARDRWAAFSLPTQGLAARIRRGWYTSALACSPRPVAAMSVPASSLPTAIDRDYTLEHKYTRAEGRIYLSGVQALVRLPLMQQMRDRAAG